MKTTRNTRENCVKLFNAMIENKHNLLVSLREEGKNKDNSRLYASLLDDLTNLGMVVDILTNKRDFDTYWDIYGAYIED